MSHRRLTPDEARAWARVARTVKPIGPKTEEIETFIDALEHGEPVLRHGKGKTAAPAPQVPVPKPPKTPAPPQNRANEKRVRRGKLVLGIADGRVYVDGEHVYTATDMRVGLKNMEPQA